MSLAYEVKESVCSSQIELLASGKVTFRQTAPTCRSHRGAVKMENVSHMKMNNSLGSFFSPSRLNGNNSIYFVSDLSSKDW